MTARVPEGFLPFDEPGTYIGMIGPLYRRREGDRITLCLPIERRHTNPMGTAHGGLLMTLVDLTLGMNVGAAIGHDVPVPTVQLSCSLIAAAKEGETVFGDAEVDRATRTFAFVSGTLRAEGRVLLRASAIFRYPAGVESAKR
jgi:uncharacterized protein (TIGR00369 family)